MFDWIRNSRRFQVGAIASLAWSALYLFVSEILGFDLMFETDSHLYLLASGDLGAFPPLELPVYPASVALLSALLPVANPVIAAEVVVLVAYVASALLLLEILQFFRLRDAVQYTLLFAFFPLVGLSDAIMPRVNALIPLMLFLALYFYVRDRNWYAVVALALSLLTHKSLWPVVLLLTLIGLLDKRLTPIQVVAVYIPLIAYWLAGTHHHNDLLWILRESVQVKVIDGGWAPYAGLVGALRRADSSMVQMLRAATIIIFLLLHVLLLLSRVWLQYRWLLALILTPLIWSVVLNPQEYWSLYSYASYSVIPVCFYTHQRASPVLRSPFTWPVFLGVSLVSQWAFAVHYSQVVR